MERLVVVRMAQTFPDMETKQDPWKSCACLSVRERSRDLESNSCLTGSNSAGSLSWIGNFFYTV